MDAIIDSRRARICPEGKVCEPAAASRLLLARSWTCGAVCVRARIVQADGEATGAGAGHDAGGGGGGDDGSGASGLEVGVRCLMLSLRALREKAGAARCPVCS